MITDMQGATTDFFADKQPVKEYDLLDCYSTTASRDRRLAILRRVQYRTTKDGKPFIRAMFEDINGCLVVGRMFDCTDMNNVARILNSLTGKLVLVDYTLDFYNGSLCLQLHEVTGISEEIAAAYVPQFVGKYSLAEVRLRGCKTILSGLEMSNPLTEFYHSFCDLSTLTEVSDESVGKGLRGIVLDIVYNVLLHSAGVSTEAILAFLFAVVSWFKLRREADVYTDDSIMLFVGYMTNKRVDTAASGMGLLSNKIAEYTSLFAGLAKVISSDSFLLYNLYTTFVEAANIKAIEAQLPPDGFCGYKSYIIRRS